MRKPALNPDLLAFEEDVRRLWGEPITNTRSITAAATGDATEVILADATSGAFSVTLPPVAEVPGRRYAIKKTDASVNAVTIDGSGAETIDGAATVVLSTRWDFRSIVSDGSAWFVEGSSITHLAEAGTGLLARLDGTGAFSGARSVDAAWTFSVTPTFSTMTLGSILFAGTGGILTQDNANLFYSDSLNSFGFGAAPTHRFDLQLGVLGDQIDAVRLTATLPTTPTNTAYGIETTVTTAGSNAQDRVGWYHVLGAGYTGTRNTIALSLLNNVAGTQAAAWDLGGNEGIRGRTASTTTGTNMGLIGAATGGNISIGTFGISDFASATKVGIGVGGAASNTLGTRIGGLFTTVAGTNPTFESAALIADNMTTTDPIFLARDNGTKVFQIIDGGRVILDSTLTNPFSAATTFAGTATYGIGGGADRDIELNFNEAGTMRFRIAMRGSTGTNELDFMDDAANTIARLVQSAAIADTQAGLLLRANRAGVFSLNQVTYGAVDSGAAGFRLLRIPN